MTTPRAAALALLALAAASCRGRTNTDAETRQSAIDFAAGTVEGRFLWNGTALAPATMGIDGGELLATDDGGHTTFTRVDHYSTRMRAGAHSLTLFYPQDNFPPRCAGNELGQVSFDVVPNATTTAEFDLTATTGWVTGIAMLDGVPTSGFLTLGIGCGVSIFAGASGAFSALLPAGAHTVQMTSIANGGFEGAFNFDVVAGTTTDIGVLNGSITAGGTVHGDVTWNGALPLSSGGFFIDATPASGNVGWTALVDGLGHYATRAPPGSYTLRLHSLGITFATATVTVSAGLDSTVDFDISSSSGQVTGVFTQGGRPANPTISIGNGVVLSAGDFDGRFSLMLPTGEQRLKVHEGEVETELTVSIGAGTTTDIGTLDLSSWDPTVDVGGGSVAGTVTWNGAPVPVPDQVWLAVSAHGESGRHWLAPLDESGQYAVSNVEPGDYVVSVGMFLSNPGSTPLAIGTPLATTNMTVAPGGATTRDFDVTAGAGRVMGTISINGAAEAGTLLADIAAPTSLTSIRVFIVVRPDGQFSHLVPPGSYTARAVAPPPVPSGTESFFLGQFSFTVVAGQTTNLDAVSDAPPGSPCPIGNECAAGLFCVDGNCCTSSCGGGLADCQACSIAAGGTTNGTCTPLTTAPVCRPSTLPCDVAETCSPASLDCPPDGFATGVTCYTAPDFCASVEQTLACSGTAPVCAVPTSWPAGGCQTIGTGSSVTVDLLGGDGVVGGVTLSFETPVTTPGQVAAIGPAGGATSTCPLPAGYDVVRNPTDSAGQFWSIEGAPTWPIPLPVKVCVHYDPSLLSPTFNQCNLRLYHGSDSTSCTPAGAGWTNINVGGVTGVCPSSGLRCTTGGPPSEPCTANTVCGMVTDHLSPFAVAAPAPGATPSIVVPGDLTVTAPGPAGTVVSFSVTASDAQDGALIPVCVPAAGTTFPIGTTRVTCTATDSDGLVATGSFNVTVRASGVGPVFTRVPGTIVAYATSVAGAKVTYTKPIAIDAVDGVRPVSCAPPSGSIFPLGKTAVTCTASDKSGNTTTATFTVWVQVQTDCDGTIFLPPIRSNGSSIFKIGRPLPAKFKLTGASADITNLVAKLIVTKVSNSIQGTAVDASDEIVDDTDFVFRYRPGPKLYAYRWKTSNLTQGTYQLNADLGDGVVHQINVSLKATP